MGNLTGQVAIVTGGSRGLGRALAGALVAEGAKVALLARPGPALDAAAAELGDMVLAVPCDLRVPEDIRSGFAAVASHFGWIDILVNNAAACLVSTIASVSDAHVRSEIETNLMAPIFCAREAIPFLKASGRGHIVNISSESSIRPFPLLTVYAATKAGLESFSHGLREEVRELGIRVTLLRSGHMATSVVDQWSAAQKEAFFEAFARSAQGAVAGSPLDPATTAGLIVDILKLPPAATVRVVELGVA